MVAISFSEKRFVDLIRQGKKDQTIRPYNEQRFDQIKRIKKLQLYYKQRTKECFKIADAELTEIFKIRLYEQSFLVMYGMPLRRLMIFNNGWFNRASIKDELEIIERDGFNNIDEFYNFFYEKYGDKLYEMEFMVIRWRLIK